MSNEMEHLTQSASQYITMLNNIGEGSELPEEIASLCAKNCKKVRNGKPLFEDREYFADQLISAKEWIGNWSIEVLELIPIASPRSTVIRYVLTTQKEGVLLVFVILKFDSDYYITEINEVHNKLEK